MPDQKITDLVDGDPLQPTDEFVVARAGDNFKIDGSAVVAAVTKHDVTLAGNTAGALALISSGTMTLAGGNNITLSQAGNAVTISAGTAAAAGTAISGIAASDTTYTSGTVTITGVGGGVTVSSNTGQRIDISVAAQSVQPETQTFIGGISASNTLYTSGSVRFTGSQAATVRSGTGQLVVIDVPAQTTQVETQTFVAGIQNSQTTYTSGTVNLSVVAGNLTIRSTTGQAFQFSASQTVQPETQTFVGGIAASNTTYTSGTVTITGVGGGITVSSNTGQRIDLSVAAQTTQTQGILSAGVSTGGNTAGNTQVSTGSRFVLVASGNATASQATAAGASTVTISVGTQTVQTQGILSAGVSTGGNTSGNTQVSTGSRLVFVGSNNITLSQGTAAGATTVTISGPSVAGAQTGISGLANSETTYTSGSVTFSALGALTIRSTTGQHFQFSVNSQTAQTGISGIANSQTTYTSGTVSLSELGAITIRSTTGNQYQLSVNAQTTQTQGILSAGVSTGGNTLGNTTVNTGSRLVFVGTNNITLSQGTAAGATTITISGPSGGAETQTAISGIAASNTTYTSGTVSITGVGGGVTVSSNTGQRVDISVAAPVAQTVQTQGILNVALSNIGNTSGDTGINSGTRMVLAGGNNVTLSASSAANATTITISAGGGAYSAGMSTNGNTSGDTGYASQRLNLIGGNNITLSGSTNGGSMSITVSAPNLGAGAFSGGASNLGNTAGATGITGTQLVIVGSGNISLSQTTGANGGTLSILGPSGATLSHWEPLGPNRQFSYSSAIFNATPQIGPFALMMDLSCSKANVLINAAGASGSTASASLWVGIYTRNASTLSMASSGSQSYSWTSNSVANGDWGGVTGPRIWSVPMDFVATPGNYWIMVNHRSSNAGSFSYGQLSHMTGASGIMGSLSNTSRHVIPGLGHFSVSTTAVPASIAFSAISGNNPSNMRSPHIQFVNFDTL